MGRRSGSSGGELFREIGRSVIDRISRITKERAAEIKSALLRWYSPAELRDFLSEVSAPHGFFTAGQGAFQFWREAYCAREFAERWFAEGVRLCEPDPPDFELKRTGVVTRWELMEVRDPREKPGAVFAEAARRHNEGLKQAVEHFDTEAHRLWLRPQLSECVDRKSKKGYPDDVGLAIYIHAWIFEEQWIEAEATLKHVLVPFTRNFQAIIVLVSGRFFEIQPDSLGAISE